VTTELKERLVGVSTTFTPVPFTFTVLRLPGRLLTMRTLPLTPFNVLEALRKKFGAPDAGAKK